MNLVLDIGNTKTKVGWFELGRLTENQHLDVITKEHWKDLLKKYPVDRVLVSSVRKTDREMFISAGTGSVIMQFLDQNLPLPMKVSYSSSETLGHDRIAAAAGAISIHPGFPLLVMDLGTAITIDFVSAEREFKGGNISPGLETRFKSLHDNTAQLPLVKKDNSYPEFGHDTKTAIAAGVQQGIVHELNGYIDLFAENYPDCRFVLTGGDALFFVPRLKRTIFVHPDLVLTGLNHILEYNNPVNRS